MDVSSKQLISSAGLDKHKFIGEEGSKVEVDMYKTFVDDSDRCYRVEFGTLEIKTEKDSDDPMGLHAVAEWGAEEGRVRERQRSGRRPGRAAGRGRKGQGQRQRQTLGSMQHL